MQPSNKKRIWSTIGIGLVLILSKLKWVLAFLKFSKFATIITMLISLVAYGLTYGWLFGVAIVYLILIHETGHVWAMKKKGIPTNPTLFIPFVGGLARGKELAKHAADDAFIAYMGPVFGFLSIVFAFLLYFIVPYDFFAFVILLGAIINLFNLLPMAPLDGGHITKAIHPVILFIGLFMGLGVALYIKSILLGILLIAGAIYSVMFYFERKDAAKNKQVLFYLKEYVTALRGNHTSKEEISEYIPLNEKQKTIVSSIFKEAMDELGKNQEVDQQELANSIEKKVFEKEKYYSYLDSFTTINLKQRFSIFFIYIALISLFIGCIYFGIQIIGSDISQFRK